MFKPTPGRGKRPAMAPAKPKPTPTGLGRAVVEGISSDDEEYPTLKKPRTAVAMPPQRKQPAKHKEKPPPPDSDSDE